mgnify:CR=1
MNIRWWHSQRILIVSLATAILAAVGVLTALVIRQQGAVCLR